MENSELQHRVQTLEENVRLLQQQVNELAKLAGKPERELRKSPYAGASET